MFFVVVFFFTHARTVFSSVIPSDGEIEIGGMRVCRICEVVIELESRGG